MAGSLYMYLPTDEPNRTRKRKRKRTRTRTRDGIQCIDVQNLNADNAVTAQSNRRRKDAPYTPHKASVEYLRQKTAMIRGST